MDLTVPEDLKEIAKILTEIRYLIKDCILKELLNQKDEIKKLREATWPICQAIKEKSQLTDINSKIKFLYDLEMNESIHLINEKSKFSENSQIKPSTYHLKEEELSRLGLK